MAIVGIERAMDVINGKKVEPEILIPTKLITQDNVDSYEGW